MNKLYVCIDCMYNEHVCVTYSVALKSIEAVFLIQFA